MNIKEQPERLTVTELVDEAYACAKEKGWHDKPATFGDRIALVHSELSEALEAFRTLDGDAFDAIREPLYSHNGNLTRDSHRFEAWEKDDFIEGACKVVPNKPEGVQSELADVVIRVGHICGLYGIDLERAVMEKMAYNRTRPYRHGGKRL